MPSPSSGPTSDSAFGRSEDMAAGPAVCSRAGSATSTSRVQGMCSATRSVFAPTGHRARCIASSSGSRIGFAGTACHPATSSYRGWRAVLNDIVTPSPTWVNTRCRRPTHFRRVRAAGCLTDRRRRRFGARSQRPTGPSSPADDRATGFCKRRHIRCAQMPLWPPSRPAGKAVDDR